MNAYQFGKWFTIAALAASWLVSPTLAQQTEPPGAGAPTTAKSEPGNNTSGKAGGTQAKSEQTLAPTEAKAGGYSPGVSETLKLFQAGVSQEVIRRYIEQSPTAYQLKAADIIALKEHSVPDELIAAMLKRGAELRAQAGLVNRATAPAPAEARAAVPGVAYSGLDPESYDFWWYHYAYPRALAAANQRLFWGGAPYYGNSFYPYGYYAPMPLYPRWGTAPPPGRLP